MQSNGNGIDSGREASCFWRWRFQPVMGLWGHLGLDYTFENPNDAAAPYLLRHVDYGLPGDRMNGEYRQCIALYCALVARNGEGWPPVRTPYGRVFITSEFIEAPVRVANFLLNCLPRFWGRCGCYHMLGPNSNTGLRCALEFCERETGYRFKRPPLRMRAGAWGWSWPGTLDPHEGPCPGYFADGRFRFREPGSVMLPLGSRPRVEVPEEEPQPHSA